MKRSIVNALCRVAEVAMLTATLLLVVTAMAWTETVEESELRAAAGRGNSDEVARLLAEGTDPNVPDHAGRTALHHAAKSVQARILNMLLEAGGDPDVQDRDGSILRIDPARRAGAIVLKLYCFKASLALVPVKKFRS